MEPYTCNPSRWLLLFLRHTRVLIFQLFSLLPIKCFLSHRLLSNVWSHQAAMKLDFLLRLSQGFYHQDKSHDQKQVREKRAWLAHVLPALLITQGSQGRNSVRQELMQRPWRNSGYWLLLTFPSACFLIEAWYGPTHNGLGPPTLITN